ncbi:hypothetical protein [Streptomyces sp. NPDC046939]|uniref:hypothetical protein n=1 Tax=Streptomyces sp. NPDC046939 TaxID=3155376 RepID=UPI003409FE79
MEWRPVVARTNRCISAVLTVAAGVLAGMAWAAPAQAADVAGQAPQATTQDFAWPTPPSGRPGAGVFSGVRDGLDSASDFVWPIDPRNAPGDFVWPVDPKNAPKDSTNDFAWPTPPARP